MAIKINWQNLQRRMINGVDVQKVMLNWVQIRPEATPVYIPWIYHNPTRWLISISKNGTTWYTLKDKNVGATQVFNYGDTWDTNKIWLFFQWGNSYGFRLPNQQGGLYDNISNYHNTSETQIDSSLYPSGYSSDTFITWHQFWTVMSWWTYEAWHLWNSSTVLDDAEFHIPSDWDWDNVLNIFEERWLCGRYHRCAYGAEPVFRYLKIPTCTTILDDWFFGYDWEIYNATYYWSSSSYSRWPNSVMMWIRDYWSYPSDGDARGNLVREFRNTPVVPDTTRTVLYQPN